MIVCFHLKLDSAQLILIQTRVCGERKKRSVTMTYTSLSGRLPKPRLITSGLFPSDLWRMPMNSGRRHAVFSAVGLSLSVQD